MMSFSTLELEEPIIDDKPLLSEGSDLPINNEDESNPEDEVIPPTDSTNSTEIDSQLELPTTEEMNNELDELLDKPLDEVDEDFNLPQNDLELFYDSQSDENLNDIENGLELITE